MKTISKETYLQALGLHHLARLHYRKGEEFDKALCSLLGLEWGGHISDSAYGERDFDEALKLSEIVVEDKPHEN